MKKDLLGEWLFGPARALPAGRPALVRALVYVAMLAAGTFVAISRLPFDQQNLVWAEDGRVFLTDAFAHDFLTNAFAPYAGYMHLFPRFAAQMVAATTPLEGVGIAINLWGAALWSAMALTAFVFLRDRIQLPLAAVLWAVVLLLPVGSLELATNVANSHWLLTLGLFVVLISRSTTRTRAVFGAVIVGVAVLSDPLTLLFLPLVVLRLVTVRGIRERVVAIVYLAAAVVQLLVVLGTHRNGETYVSLFGLLKTYLVRTVWGTLAGGVWGNQFYYAAGSAVTIPLGAAIVALLVAGIAFRWGRAGLAVTALVSSIGYFFVVGAMTWVQIAAVPGGNEVTRAGRYVIVPGLLLLVALIATISVWIPTRERARTTRARVGRVALIVVTAAVLIAPGISEFQTPSYKEGNPQTSDAIEYVRSQCVGKPDSTVQEVQVGPLGWQITITCEVLREHP